MGHAEARHARHLDAVLEHPEEADRRLLGTFVREVRRIGVEPHADFRLGYPGRTVAADAHFAEVHETLSNLLRVAERRRRRQRGSSPIDRAILDDLEHPRPPLRLRDGSRHVEDPRVREPGRASGEEYNQSDQDSYRPHHSLSFQCLPSIQAPIHRRRPTWPWCLPGAVPAPPTRRECCAASAACCRSCACPSWSAFPPAASTPCSSPRTRRRWARRHAPWRTSGEGSTPPTSSASIPRRSP